MKLISRIAVLAVLAALLGAPIAEARTRVYVRIGPPPLVVEQRAVAPVSSYVWQPGYHRWSGTEYVWVPGAWVAPPYARARWTEGRWRHSHRGYYWQEGRWRRR